MEYRLSAYSLPLEWGDCKYIFSTRSKALVKVVPSLWEALKNGSYFSESGINSNSLIRKLVDSFVITTEKEDNLYYDKLKIQFLRKSFQTSHLSLTILPTQACNLCCSYCFEGNKNPISMTEEVQDALVDYISRQPIKTYSLSWFGGEPLLRADIIESILKKLSNFSQIKLTRHNLITNGTFLNQNTYELFHQFPLNSIQVTLDGKKENHDKLRCDRKGNGSFELIKSNLINFIDEFPQTHISIRINIAKNNASDFNSIHGEVSQWFKGKKVSHNIYPGIIKKTDDNIVDTGCLNKSEQQDFYLALHSEGIKFHGFPKNEIGGCTATTSKSLVVGSDGAVYKCWEDVGKEELVVGSILKKDFGHEEVLAGYLLKGSKFSNDECRRCGYLPICSGGCPKDRILNLDIKPHQCSLYSINEGKLLKRILKDTIDSN